MAAALSIPFRAVECGVHILGLRTSLVSIPSRSIASWVPSISTCLASEGIEGILNRPFSRRL